MITLIIVSTKDTFHSKLGYFNIYFCCIFWSLFELYRCKKNDWQFVISDSDEWTQIITMGRRTTWQSFPHSQPTVFHNIIPSWQL